jgi:3-dehydroquinate synthase
VRAIHVKTASASYSVHVGGDFVSRFGHHLRKLEGARKGQIFILTSPQIWSLWGKQLLEAFPPDRQPSVLFLAPGEANKRLAQVERLSAELASAGADRSSLLIAFGGGIVGDVGGFLAAIYMRGIDYIQMPTTLLAQVDSSVGGKTGVNLSVGKNLIGSFHHPLAVFADVGMLKTLPERELRAGLFESIKAGVIRDASLFRFLERNQEAILACDADALKQVIGASVRMKAEVVGIDERESGLRMILNFGHTIGHAIEALTHYRGPLHGEAVGWGMRVAVEASRMRGLPNLDADRILAAIDALGLPPLPRLTARRLLNAAAGDKKRIAGIRHFVLLERIGQAKVVQDLTDEELLRAVQCGLQLAR